MPRKLRWAALKSIAPIIRSLNRGGRCVDAHRGGILVETPITPHFGLAGNPGYSRASLALCAIPHILNGIGCPQPTVSPNKLRSSVNAATHDIKKNHLLTALPNSVQERWLPQLESVQMPLGGVLYESGGTLSHVYFPTTSIVSLLYVMENGASAEIAVVGNEGIVGISLFMGGESTPSRAVVQSAGHGFRLKSAIVKDEFNQGGPVLHLLLRYTQALITQMAQTAVCNRHHSLDQQLCRWLLLSLDRLQGDELLMTQELIANMLGVRREGVTEGAMKLQQAGLIRYSRGRISVLDRSGLEKRTCECYAVVKKEYDRLLPDKRPS
jgi:CRP-like cAMP-binding protein